MQAVLGRIGFFRHAPGVGRNEKHADARLVAALAPGARGHDQGVGVLAVEHDELLAVDHPARTLLLGGGGDVMQVVARVLLELRKSKGLAAVDDAGHMRGLLRVRPAMAQEAAADHDGREIGLEHQRLAERFHHDGGLAAAAAEAAVFLGKGKTEQALLGELAPDGFAPAALLLHVFLALLEIIRVGQEAVDALLEKALLLGQIEIHFSLLSRYSLIRHGRACPGHPRLCISEGRRGCPAQGRA